MSARLVRTERAGPDLRARRLVFDDESTRTTSAAASRILGLEEGVELGADAIEAALAEVEPRLAKDHALRLLGYRERSTAEVRTRLTDAGHPSPVVEGVLVRFRELELLDDARFADMWARSRAAAGYGRRRVARELSQKGVDAETAQVALDAAFSPASQAERARAVLRGSRPSTRAERDRLLRRLVARGFDVGTALEALDFSKDQYDVGGSDLE